MSRSFVLVLYNCVLPVFFILSFPLWLLKMWRRGGYGSGLLERFGRFEAEAASEPQGVVYIHAVSVGEVLIAQRLIDQWLMDYPEDVIVLAATTSTGHAVAREKSPSGVRVIYSPLDFTWIVSSVLRRFTPRQIVLIEAEMWPNLLHRARKSEIPISVVNARLSHRSEARFHKAGALVKPIFEMVDLFAVQNAGDAERFTGLGISAEKIHVTGSIKFDPSGGAPPRQRQEFSDIIHDFGKDKPVVLAASTHAGEEKLIGEAILKLDSEVIYLVVPRHAERRATVKADLEAIGFDVRLRSDYQKPHRPEKSCLIVDTTGELRDWTAHADMVVIGKSWLGQGGQNPAEAIVAGVPVICGPNMGNFEPLITMLREQHSVHVLTSGDELPHTIDSLLKNPDQCKDQIHSAKKILALHEGAVKRTLDLVYLKAFVR